MNYLACIAIAASAAMTEAMIGRGEGGELPPLAGRVCDFPVHTSFVRILSMLYELHLSAAHSFVCGQDSPHPLSIPRCRVAKGFHVGSSHYEIARRLVA